MARPNLIFKKPTGGINSDTNPNDIPAGSMLGALDITDINHGELNEDGYTQLNNDTKYAFTLGTAALINKKYYLEFVVPSADFNIEIKVIHRSNTWNVPITTAVTTAVPADVFTAISGEFTANYDGLYTGFVHTFTLVKASNGILGFNLEFGNFGYDDFFLEVSITDNLDPTITYDYKLFVVQDSVSVDKVGVLKSVEITSLGSKMFIWSTVEVPDANAVPYYNGIFTSPVLTDGYYEALIESSQEYAIPVNTEIKIFNNAVGNEGDINGYFLTGESNQFIGQMNVPNLASPPMPSISLATDGNSAYFNTRTISCIGVAEKNETTGEWTYIELLRSCNLNFRTGYPIQAKVSQTDIGYLFTWVDGFNNVARRLTYRGDFVAGGFLEINNPLNKYDLDTINQESQLIVPNNLARITLGNSYDLDNYESQITGVKPTATYQVFVRFATEDNQFGVFSPPSNTTTIFNQQPSGSWSEQVAGVTSGAALIIDITNYTKELYKFFQVAIVEMTSSSFNVYALPQQEINDQDSIRVIDTGRRANEYVLLDSALINELQLTFLGAKSIENYDNYIELANVKNQTRYDLTEWAKTIDVYYEQELRPPTNVDEDIYINQYYVWFNQKYCKWLSDRYLSYAPFETVRWAILVWFKEGGAPLAFHIGDYRVDETNGLPNDYTGLAWSDTDNNVLQIVAKFTNIDLNYQLSTGELLSDIVQDFRFVRADITQEMLWSGVALTGDNIDSPSTVSYINKRYTGSSDADTDLQNNKFFTYIPDFINNGYKFARQAGDKAYFIEPTLQTNGASDEYADYYGNNQNTGMSWGDGIVVDDVKDLYGIDTDLDYSTIKPFGLGNKFDGRFSRVMTLNTDIPTPVAPTPRNCYGFYYVRELTEKYGNIYAEKFYIVLSDYFNPTTHTASTVYTAYSGNMFIQKSYYTIEQTPASVTGSDLYLSQKVLGFYSMNRYNSQLRNGIFLQYNRFNYPLYTTKPILDDTYTYDTTFNPRYIFQNQQIFNPSLTYIEQEKATIYWSEKAIDNGTFGANRVFRPLNKKALEERYGEITHLETFNIESQSYLATWQPYQFTLQYFNNSGQLITENSQVLLGTGDVMGRKGVDVTRFGSSHKWSIVKGVNAQGKPVMYWYSANERHMMRMGADGLSNISLGAGFETYLNKYCLLSDPSNITDAPTKFYGVHGVWNDLKKQYILTFRGIRQHTTYSDSVNYVKGEWVTDGTFFGFEEIPVLYKCLQSNIDVALSNTAYWEKFDYYNRESIGFFTIVWDEYSNSLKTELTHLPLIYGEYKNTFVSPSPIYTICNLIYEHNQENHARYYCKIPTETEYQITNNGKDYTYNDVLYSDYVFTSVDDISLVFGIDTFPFNMDDLIDEVHKSFYVIYNDVYYRIKEFIDPYAFTVDKYEDMGIPLNTAIPLINTQCNTGQPYFEQVINETKKDYSWYGQLTMFIDTPVKRVEFVAGLDSLGQKTTQSYLESDEFKYFNGTINSQIKNDTTNNPTDNNAGKNFVQGYWMKVKTLFTPNIKNRINKYSVKAQPLQPTLK